MSPRAPEAVRSTLRRRLIVAIASILGVVVLLSWLIRPSCGSGSLWRRTKAIADLNTLQKIATGIFTETGRWPQSIEAMVNAMDSSGKALMNSLDEFPKDLWGHPYRYELLKDAVRITCLGSDGAAGGEGEAADLVVPEERS